MLSLTEYGFYPDKIVPDVWQHSHLPVYAYQDGSVLIFRSEKHDSSVRVPAMHSSMCNMVAASFLDFLDYMENLTKNDECVII